MGAAFKKHKIFQGSKESRCNVSKVSKSHLIQPIQAEQTVKPNNSQLFFERGMKGFVDKTMTRREGN